MNTNVHHRPSCHLAPLGRVPRRPLCVTEAPSEWCSRDSLKKLATPDTPSHRRTWKHDTATRATSAECTVANTEQNESMLHMLICPNRDLKELWRLAEHFQRTTLNNTQHWRMPETIIFNLDSRGDTLAEPSRAWIRQRAVRREDRRSTVRGRCTRHEGA